MARTRSAENATDPGTGRPLPAGVEYRGLHQYRARKTLQGKRVYQTFDTAKAAKDWLDDKASEVRQGTYVDRTQLDRITLGDLVRRFVAECMQDGGERRGAAEDRGHIPAILADPIEKVSLSELMPSSVRGFRDRQLAVGMSKATVVKRMNLLQAILKHARAEWDVPLKENPASGEHVKRPKGADKKRNRRLRVPSPAAIRLAEARGEDRPITEEEALYDALSRSCNEWDVWITRWPIAQGTRQGEAIGLRWRDLDLEARTMTVYGRLGLGAKNADHKEELTPEIRPLMPDAMAILRAIQPEGGADPDILVFPVGDYLAFRVRFGRLLSRAAAKMTGVMKDLRYLRNLRYHDLRHEATSRLAKIYKNREDLRRVTGHKDLKSLDRYYQPDPTELAMIAEEYELARKAGIVVPLSVERDAAALAEKAAAD